MQTSSDYEPVIGDLEFVTDGEKTGEDGYFVELGPSIQWVQLDLGKSYSLHAILVWHYHSQARVYRDTIIQPQRGTHHEEANTDTPIVVVARRIPVVGDFL